MPNQNNESKISRKTKLKLGKGTYTPDAQNSDLSNADKKDKWQDHNKKGVLGYLKKFWIFLWDDESWLSWAVSVLIAFILIKFVVYPVLGLLFGTSFPIVAVVSGSMEHEGSFDSWWESQALCSGNRVCSQREHYEKYDISKEDFKDFRFKNGFNKGDIMILYGKNSDKIVVGDVIVFMANRPDPIIHRVVEVNTLENGAPNFVTKGDHNFASFEFEKQITEDRLVGTAVFRLPYLGYIKIGFSKILSVFGI